MTRTPIKKRRTKPRRGPLRDPKYRKWIACHPCAVWGSDSFNRMTPISIAAHTENNGMRSKGPDSSCAPLCIKHHAEYDAGRKAFETKYGVDMKAIAKEHWERYQRELSTGD